MTPRELPELPGLTSYELNDGIATITMDDGRANALSPELIGELRERFDTAESDEAVVILTGREKTFSAGFDLKSFETRAAEMVGGGARLAERMLSFPHPIVAACNGNAIAMGGFTLLCCDYRVGASGEFKIGLNEVAIGLTVPWFGVSVARHRLARPYFDRCTITGTFLGPGEAREAGFLDELVEPGELMSAAGKAAASLASINRAAHAATKLRVRAEAIEGVRDGAERIEGSGREW